MTSASRRGSDLFRALQVALLCSCGATLVAAQDAAIDEAGKVDATQDPSASQTIVSSPILVLNQEAVFSQSALGQRVIAELERDRNALAAENRRIEAELSTEEQELTKRRKTLSATEFATLARDFDTKVQTMRDSQDRKARALQERLDAERRNFGAQIGPILAEIARQRGAAVILDNTVVLMSFDIFDITSDVIQRLDTAIGDGRSDLGAPLSNGSPNLTDPNLRPVPRLGTSLGTGAE